MTEDPLVPVDPLEVAPDLTADRKTAKRSELRTRAISAAVLATAVVLLAYYGGLPFRILCVIAGLVVLQEWTAMTGCLRPFGSAQAFSVGTFFAVAVAVLVGAYTTALVVTFTGFAVAYAISFVRLREVPRPEDARHWSWMSLGILYAALFMIAFAALRGDTPLGLAASAFLLAIVWATDIFAYFVGKSLGGPKLARAISPNKTWSGFLGGVFFAIVAAALVVYFEIAQGVIDRFPWWIVPVAIILSVVSQCGDLFESWVKRRSGAKDSGRIIPGHGGMMDRIDGLGAAAVAALALLVLATGGTDIDLALAGLFG